MLNRVVPRPRGFWALSEAGSALTKPFDIPVSRNLLAMAMPFVRVASAALLVLIYKPWLARGPMPHAQAAM